MWRGACAIAAATLAFSTTAIAQSDPCAVERDSLRAQTLRYSVYFRATPTPEVGRHFALNFSVCGLNGAKSPESVTVDARMPSHGHGMNYRPTLTALGAGRYRAEGLMLHMSGVWELAFIVRDAGMSERITHTLKVQ
ncbi:MAG: hypothetical protein V4637_05915 [Pseudomonadota bacterium]